MSLLMGHVFEAVLDVKNQRSVRKMVFVDFPMDCALQTHKDVRILKSVVQAINVYIVLLLDVYARNIPIIEKAFS